MKVQELIAKINNDGFNLSNELQVKKYLPIEVKKIIAQGVIYECTDSEFGETKVDSVQKYMSYVRYMITTHTILEYEDIEYDILCSTEFSDGSLLDAIFECFERDADECEMILDFMFDDYMRTLIIDATIAKFANDLSATINAFIEKIGDLNVESIIPKDLNVEKINGFFK